MLHVALFLENFSSSVAEGLDVGLLDGFTPLELLDPLVQVVDGRAVARGFLLRHFPCCPQFLAKYEL